MKIAVTNKGRERCRRSSMIAGFVRGRDVDSDLELALGALVAADGDGERHVLRDVAAALGVLSSDFRLVSTFFARARES